MNLLIAWNSRLDFDSFEHLMKTLNVKNLYDLYFDREHVFNMKDVRYIALDGYAPFEFYEKAIKDAIPIDGELLEKMQPYERMAFEIINRWKRSITTRFDFFELRRIYNVYLRYWNDFIVKNKIDCFVIDADPHASITYIAYALCRMYGIRTVHANWLPTAYGQLLSKFYVSELDSPWSVYPDVYKELCVKYNDIPETDIPLLPCVDKYFSIYGKEKVSKSKTVIEIKSTEKKSDKVNRYINRLLLYTKTRRYKILTNKLVYLVKIKPKTSAILKYAEKLETEPDLTRDFVFFPLHYQPEAATLPNGGYFTDMHLIISMVSNNLPLGTLLYVKEHPVFWKIEERVCCMSETRSKAYYDEIVKLPNVKLVRHDYPSIKLIKNSKALVTLNGSSGIEALFSYKPVIMFGNIFYMHAPGVYKIKTNSECRDVLKEAFEGTLKSITSKELKLYFKAFESFVGEGSYQNLPTQGYEGFPQLTEGEDCENSVNALLTYMRLYAPELIHEYDI